MIGDVVLDYGSFTWCRGMGRVGLTLRGRLQVLVGLSGMLDRVTGPRRPQPPLPRGDEPREHVATDGRLVKGGALRVLQLLVLQSPALQLLPYLVLFHEALVNDCKEHVYQHVSEQDNIRVGVKHILEWVSHPQLRRIKGSQEHLKAGNQTGLYCGEVTDMCAENLVAHEDIAHEDYKHQENEVGHIRRTTCQGLEHHLHAWEDLEILEQAKHDHHCVDCTYSDEPLEFLASLEEVEDHLRVTAPTGI
mmetsp:Transcript_86729/g.253826  ORF Transcript_86729/g.253826 Transcript_86729/m.253826 type:complete len:248 (+) Transcript_86729:905-1648(+)